MVYVAVVERVHANQGTVLVRIQNGFELEELHNVAIASVANGDLLVYELATSLWKNKSVGTLGLAIGVKNVDQCFVCHSGFSIRPESVSMHAVACASHRACAG